MQANADRRRRKLNKLMLIQNHLLARTQDNKAEHKLSLGITEMWLKTHSP